MNCKMRYIIMLMLAIPFIMVPNLEAFDLQISEGKLSVSADNVPLQDLLRTLSYNGIIVRIDPKINPSVSAEFSNRDLEAGLKSIIKPNNHAFVWDETQPLSSSKSRPFQLKEIHVFRPGEKERMVIIEPGDEEDFDLPEEETRVTIKNDKVYVPVTIVYQDRQIETTLLLDTGASGILLHRNVAEQLDINQSTPSKAQGVGGMEIETHRARLQSVIVGPIEKQNLVANIVDFQSKSGEPDPLYNGLLGMSFLKGIQFTTDFDNQVVRWLKWEPGQ